MAAQIDPLDPDWIASKDFDASFRGFDQSQVRSYLRQLAKELRNDQQGRAQTQSDLDAQSEIVADLQDALAAKTAQLGEVEHELETALAKVVEIQATPAVVVEPQELDSAQLTKMLGEETVRVLDSARGAAADIRAKAEKESTDRTAELDKVQKDTNAQLAEQRKTADTEVAKLRSDATRDSKAVADAALSESTTLLSDAKTSAQQTKSEAEGVAAALVADAGAAAEATKSSAQDVAVAVKQRGEEVAKSTRLAAEADAEKTRKDAQQAKSDADAGAARLRAEAAADVETARDSAREEARLMLTEAQTLREKVLEDLVKRRRIARQQIDQAKAARDRLTRALISAGQQIDLATEELEISVPEAKWAMKNAGSRLAGTESEQTTVLAEGLDQARSKGKTLSPERVSLAGAEEGSKPAARKQAVAKPAITLPVKKSDPVEVEEAAPVEVMPAAEAAPVVEDAPVEDAPVEEAVVEEALPQDDAPPEDDLVIDLGDDGLEAEASDDLDSIFARLRGDSAVPVVEVPDLAELRHAESEATVDVEVEAAQSAPAESTPAEPAPATATRVSDEVPAEPVASKRKGRGETAAELVRTTPTGPEPETVEAADVVEDAEPVADVLPPFADRDIAVTRFGPDLRRKLKRALADDQSDVLDRLRRSKQLGVDDLPSSDSQKDLFAEAVKAGLLGVAVAGSASIGGADASGSDLDELVGQMAKDLQAPLRTKVERSVSAADGDAEEVLEPVRAHYREARAASLPDLVDDALAQAFALGVYGAIGKKSELVWVVDPRAKTSPDCFDNTLEEGVKKPGSFPTGHKLPLGGPGCRCLVLPAATFRA